MITIIKRNKIDIEKYNLCLENAVQNADYAAIHFLDIVADEDWLILEYSDYQAVMPLMIKKKFGIPFVIMPKICQQLGVFSETDNPTLNAAFHGFLMEKFLVVQYAFNSENHFPYAINCKTSYRIQKSEYASVKKKYSVHRRRNVRILDDFKDHLQFRNDINSSDRSFFLNNMKGATSKSDCEAYYHKFLSLVNAKIGWCSVMEYKNEAQSFVYLYEGKNQFYLSLFVNNFPVVNTNFPSIMIDYVLQNVIELKSFDFMGSEVENVAKFNERFGAIAYQYPIVYQTKKQIITSIFKKYIPFL